MSRPTTVEFSSYASSLITTNPNASRRQNASSRYSKKQYKGKRKRVEAPTVNLNHKTKTSRTSTSTSRRSTNNNNTNSYIGSRAVSRAKAVSEGAGGSDRVICAISEGRGAATVVGLCFLILGTNECVVCNIVDSQTYIRTLQKLDVFNPTEILMPAASVTGPTKSKLCILIEQYFGGAKLISTNRRDYNAPTGIEYLTKWVAPAEAESVSYELSTKYYTACSAAAAIQYTQSKYHIDYTTKVIRIKFQASEDSMALSSATIKALELIHNSVDLNRGMSLYKIMNRTQTAMGARMLRSSIIQPLTNINALTKRQDAVKELYENSLICSEITKSE